MIPAKVKIDPAWELEIRGDVGPQYHGMSNRGHDRLHHGIKSQSTDRALDSGFGGTGDASANAAATPPPQAETAAPGILDPGGAVIQ